MIRLATVTLPCASLTDPWASLVVSGIKTLETRKGTILSGFSGPLVIHRTLARPAVYDVSRWGITLPVARPAGWPDDDRGCALGVVYVTRTYRLRHPPTPELQRRSCFLEIDGRYLSELTRAAWFPAPLPACGKQSRFPVEVPVDYLPDWARP